MSEQQPHKNPWADKLDEVSLPDLVEAKQQLFLQLDKDMPLVKRKSRWQWLLLLLLILLIGVCNCPGIWRSMNSGTANNDTIHTGPTLPSDKNNAVLNENNTNDKKQATANGENDLKHTVDVTQNAEQNKGLSVVSDESVTSKDINKIKEQNLKEEKEKDNKNISFTKRRSKFYSSINQNKSLTKKNSPQRNDDAGKRRSGTNINSIPADKKEDEQNDSKKEEQAVVASSSTTVPLVKATDDSIVSVDSSSKVNTVKNVTKADSTKKKPKANKSRWAVAVGVNQVFAINDQQYAGVNANGKKNIIGDYIPVPQVRYHVNDKLYLQMELGINSPQYTALLFAGFYGDSLTSIRQKLYISKLYYLRVPAGIHYSVAKNFYTGVGLQYSRLINAAGSPGGDSLRSFRYVNLKNEPAYSLLNKTDIGFYIDAGYHWKKISGGLRYNRSFGNFIDVNVPGVGDVKATNSSLLLYFRYTIWRSKPTNK